MVNDNTPFQGEPLSSLEANDGCNEASERSEDVLMEIVRSRATRDDRAATRTGEEVIAPQVNPGDVVDKTQTLAEEDYKEKSDDKEQAAKVGVGLPTEEVTVAVAESLEISLPGAYSMGNNSTPNPEDQAHGIRQEIISDTDRHQDEEQPCQLQDSNRTSATVSTSAAQEQSLVEALPVSEEHLDLNVARPFQQNGTGRSNGSTTATDAFRRNLLLLGACGLMLVGVLLGFAAGFWASRETQGDDGASSPSSSPTMAATTSAPTVDTTNLGVIDADLLADDTRLALLDPTSPQAQAYLWLEQDPHLPHYLQWRRVQRFALATLFLATDGPNWKRNDGWLDYHPVSECEWIQVGGFNTTLFRHIHDFTSVFIDFTMEYVTTGGFNLGAFAGDESDADLDCDEQGRIRFLRLAYNNLQGVLPPEVALLTNLREVVFNHNHFVGTIPSQIGLLTQLEQLHFTANMQMTGTLPTEVGMLSNLRIFGLTSMTRLQGAIPSQVGTMSKLGGFLIQSSGLEGQIPSQMGLLSGLHLFHANGAKLTGTIPPEIFRSSLRYFNVGGVGQLEGTLPTEIQVASHLEILDLNGNQLTGPLPGHLDQLTELKLLNVNTNALTGYLSPQLGSMTNLQVLYMSGNDFSGSVPSEVGLLTSMSFLDLGENPQLSGTIPDVVCTTALELSFNCSANLCGCNGCRCGSG